MFRAVLKLHVPFQLGLTRMNIIPAISTRAISSFVSTIPEGAAENSQAKEWLVIIPDRKGVLERRYEIRPQHHKNFRRLHKEGHISFAGPVFTQPCVKNPEGENRPFMGSVIVLRDVTRDNIYKLLESDLFIKEGIWDWDNVKIFPFQSQVQKPQPKPGDAWDVHMN